MASVVSSENSKSTVVSDGTLYGYINIPAKSNKPTLLFVHGYPSSSYHWHKQVSQCQASGFGMIAPDLLGYGDTDKPSNVEAYDNTIIARQLIDLLDHEKLGIVIGVGHDWGSTVLSTTARLYTDRFEKLIFLTRAYVSSQALLTNIDAINEATTLAIGWPIYGYWFFHNKPEAASVMESADPMTTATLMYPEDPWIWKENMCQPGGIEDWLRNNKTTKLASWITHEEVSTHGKILAAGGYDGPLNYYKQGMAGISHASELKINPEYATTRFSLPTLFVGSNQDVICVPAFQEATMKDFFDNLTVKDIDTGHWCMLEKPKELWEIMQDWIEKVE